MLSEINLTEIEPGKIYIISDIAEKSEYAHKLEKLGFTRGTPVEKGLSNIKNPMVIKLRGSRIALRTNEAKIVKVKEIQ